MRKGHARVSLRKSSYAVPSVGTGVTQGKHRAEAWRSPAAAEHGLLEALREAPGGASAGTRSMRRGRCGQGSTVRLVEAMIPAFHFSPGGRGNPLQILDPKMIQEPESWLS